MKDFGDEKKIRVPSEEGKNRYIKELSLDGCFYRLRKSRIKPQYQGNSGSFIILRHMTVDVTFHSCRVFAQRAKSSNICDQNTLEIMSHREERRSVARVNSHSTYSIRECDRASRAFYAHKFLLRRMLDPLISRLNVHD